MRTRWAATSAEVLSSARFSDSSWSCICPTSVSNATRSPAALAPVCRCCGAACAKGATDAPSCADRRRPTRPPMTSSLAGDEASRNAAATGSPTFRRSWHRSRGIQGRFPEIGGAAWPRNCLSRRSLFHGRVRTCLEVSAMSAKRSRQSPPRQREGRASLTVVVAALLLGGAAWAVRSFSASAGETTAVVARAPDAGSAFAPTAANATRDAAPAPAGMAWIPGGEFSMGANDPPDMSPVGMQATYDARPIHRVYVDGFLIDKTDVTNAQFAAFVRATGYVTVAERKPRAEEFPGAPPENLVAGSVVFSTAESAGAVDGLFPVVELHPRRELAASDRTHVRHRGEGRLSGRACGVRRC